MQHPKRLGKYHVAERVGEGAMGVVYKGFDPDIQRVVALKTIRRQANALANFGGSIAQRFRNEAQAAGRLSHPGIVAVHEYGEDGAVAYIAMEYVAGNSLARYLARHVYFGDADIVSLLVQLLDALDHAHSQGVWHRDIKPGNLLIARDGKVKLADFGIAHIDSAASTLPDTLIGTPAYMAPEQFLRTPVDHRVDLYAAGVLLYQLLTGRPPFGGDTEVLIDKVVHQVPAPPSQVGSCHRKPCFDAVVAKALAKAPEQRYTSAREFRDALLGVVSAPVTATLSGEIAGMELLPSERRLGTGASAGSGASGSGSGLSTAAPTEWDPAVLSQVVCALAHHVGPLAKLLVRRAASQCGDMAALRRQLADHVTDPAQRAAFIGQYAAAQPSYGLVAEATSGPASRPSALLDDAVMKRSQQLLAAYVGPIAKAMVKTSAATAIDREHFYSLLADLVPASRVRDQLLRDLSRLS